LKKQELNTNSKITEQLMSDFVAQASIFLILI